MSSAPSTAIGTALASAKAALAQLWTGASGWMSTGRVARRLGYTPRRIRQMIDEGKIPAVRAHETADYRIPMEWVNAQLKRGVVRRKPGE